MMATKPKYLSNPINHSEPIGHKVETVFDDDGYTVAPSTLANQAAEEDKGHNPDYFPSMGGTQESQNAVGKGANPSADVATKNDTTIDPVFIEPSPTADGDTVPLTVPASLPVNAPITEPNGEVHKAGETPKSATATDGKLVQGKTKPGAGLDGKISPSEIVEPAKIVGGDAAKTAPVAPSVTVTDTKTDTTKPSTSKKA
jgi:hypothetical protein